MINSADLDQFATWSVFTLIVSLTKPTELDHTVCKGKANPDTAGPVLRQALLLQKTIYRYSMDYILNVVVLIKRSMASQIL